jgi:hypothetical protein
MPGRVLVAGPGWVRGRVQPVDGTASVSLTGWEERALRDREGFARDLRAMGLADAEFRQGMAVRDNAEADVAAAVEAFWAAYDARAKRYDPSTPPDPGEEVRMVSDAAIAKAWRRLGDWWAGRATKMESREDVEVRLPLFLLAAAAGKGCRADFTISAGSERRLGWELTVGGAGLSAEARVTVTAEATFAAEDGQAKLVFLPVMAALEKIVVRQEGAEPTRRYRLDLAGLRDTPPAPGLLLLAADELPPRGPLVQTYPLAGDPTGALATYTYGYEQEKPSSLRIPLGVPGVKLSLTAKSSITSSVTVTYQLRSGRDYKLYRAEDGDGLVWA